MRLASVWDSCPVPSTKKRLTRTCARSTTHCDVLEPETIPSSWKRAPLRSRRWRTCAVRTLNDAFIILDEAQNTTAEQMKVFLTRLGFGSKMVITGDITQIDLPGGAASGLKQVRNIVTAWRIFTSASWNPLTWSATPWCRTLCPPTISGAKIRRTWNASATVRSSAPPSGRGREAAGLRRHQRRLEKKNANNTDNAHPEGR